MVSNNRNSELGIEKPSSELAREDVCDWIDEHADALYRFAIKRVRDQSDCEDLLQETFIAAWRARKNFRGKSQIRTWLIAILRLKIIDTYRRRNPDKTMQSLEEHAHSESLATDWGSRPESALEVNEFHTVYRGCLDHLPATLARAYLLREMDGCTPQEICELLSITESNLSVRLHRARQQLRQCLSIHWFSKG